MSSNLVKQRYTLLPKTEDKRMIDSNELIRRRLAQLSIPESQGFVSGLAAEVVEVSAEADAEAGNVIKSGEDVRAALEQAQSEAEAIREAARLEADRIAAEARAQIRAEREQAVREGRQEGYNEGHAKAQAEGEAAKRQLLEKERQLEEEYGQLIDTLEPRLVDAITGIYEHIFQVELGSHREILAYLIASTLRGQEGGREFLIHVSKDDYPYVSMQRKAILAGAVAASCNVDVVEDLTLGKNQCLIETDNGIFDCGLGTQLAELRSRLMLLAWSKEE